jgi:hypothetical protein
LWLQTEEALSFGAATNSGRILSESLAGSHRNTQAGGVNGAVTEYHCMYLGIKIQ